MNDDTARWHLTETIFFEAVELAEPQRTGLLQQRCAGDASLMVELRALLQACADEEMEQQSRATSPPVEDGREVGHYSIDRLLGRGGMGAVYLAHRIDGQFQQQVALKIIDMPLATEMFRERFRAERQILAGLSHPYIARLLDGGVTENGELYLAMELVDGVCITDFCRQHALPVKARVQLFLKLCEAVQYAHRNLIVHRDLKPENILVAGDSTPHLLDFGTATIIQPLAARAGDNATRPGMQAFTPRYASPEQILGRPISIASDIYSLGVLLYVLLTDTAPYQLADFSTEELVRVICHQQPPRPGSVSSAVARLDADLDAIVMMALRKEPAERYATVENLAADLQAWLEQRPVRARLGNLRYRGLKFARRNRLALSIASLLLLAICAGILGTLLQSRRVNLERQRAEARSADLQQLSSSLLSEIDDAIKDLPGSTPVQHLLVNRVLEHLDRMSRDSGSDPNVALDILNAYTKLANVQGNPANQNIGDATGALRSLDKAEAFAAARHIADSTNPAVLVAVSAEQQSRSSILSALGRDREAEAALANSLRILERRLAVLHPSASDLAELASAYNALGDQRGRHGADDPHDPDSAEAAFRRSLELSGRALAIDPHFQRSLRDLPVVHMKLGAYLQQPDPATALQEEQRSLDAFAALPAELQATQTVKRGKAYAYRQLGGTLFAAADFPAAINAFDQARLLDEPYALADPNDTSASYALANDLRFEADVYLSLLEPAYNSNRSNDAAAVRLAIPLSRRALQLMDHLVALAPENPAWLASEASTQTLLGTVEQRTPDAREGFALARTGVAILRKAAGRPDAPYVLLVTATEVSLFVEPAALRDPAWTLHAAERVVTLSHRRNPEYLALLARAANDAGNPAEAREAAQQGLALLLARQPGSAATAVPGRARRLLVSELSRAQANQ